MTRTVRKLISRQVLPFWCRGKTSLERRIRALYTGPNLEHQVIELTYTVAAL